MTSTIQTRSTTINTVTARSNTSHVLTAIDGALNDWQVSQDAMRWTPDPATRSRRPNTSHAELWTIDDHGDAHQVGGIIEIITADLTAFDSATDQAIGAMNADLAASQQQRQLDFLDGIRQLHAQIDTAFSKYAPAFGRPRRRTHNEPPADPKAHALHARQHRNTGPAKPPAGHRPPKYLIR